MSGKNFACHVVGGGLVLASREADAAKILQCTVKALKTRNYPADMPVVQRLRNPDMENGTINYYVVDKESFYNIASEYITLVNLFWIVI